MNARPPVRARGHEARIVPDDDRPKVAKFHFCLCPPQSSRANRRSPYAGDSVGVVVKNGVTFEGIRDATFASLVRNVAARTLFRPAELDGCAVEGIARVTYTF